MNRTSNLILLAVAAGACAAALFIASAAHALSPLVQIDDTDSAAQGCDDASRYYPHPVLPAAERH